MWGPLVLFAIGKAPTAIPRRQLLAAKKTAVNRWQAATAYGHLTMSPFFAFDDEPYTTYLKVT
jgi:hypothetical protein